MPLFEYKGYSRSGKKVSGTMDAETPILAKEKLAEKGVYPFALQKLQPAKKQESVFNLLLFKKISQKKILEYTETLETFLNSGFTVHDSLKAIADQVSSKNWRNIILSIEQDIAAGLHLSDALRNHPGVFSEFYINLVETGETSGELEQTVSRLREYLDRKMELKRRLINNLTYPVLMMVMGILVVIFLFTKVLPVIVKMLQQMKVALPLPTRILIGCVEFTRDYGLAIALFVVLVIVSFKLMMRVPRFKLFIHKLVLKIPFIGKLVIMIEMERFSNVVATMLKSGIPLPLALEASGNITRNENIRECLLNTREAIIEGTGMAKIMKQQEIYPRNMIQFIHAGEKTGTLEIMFDRCAKNFQKELDLYTKSLSALVEPLIIIILGVSVGLIAISILLPIFEMNAAIGG